MVLGKSKHLTYTEVGTKNAPHAAQAAWDARPDGSAVTGFQFPADKIRSQPLAWPQKSATAALMASSLPSEAPTCWSMFHQAVRAAAQPVVTW